jgi:hypothetical protein
MIQNKKAQEDTVETEQAALTRRVTELTDGNMRLDEMLARAKLKLDQQVSAEKALEEQLSKVKRNV